MPLIQCPDCSREVSDQAPACPGCGRPISVQRVALESEPVRVAPTQTGESFLTRDRGCGDLLLIFIVVPLILFLILVVMT